MILAEHRSERAKAIWRRAETLGFDHAWTYDHLAWRTLRDSPWFGTIATLAAAATVTERLRIGTLVASPNIRHPVLFAKEIMSLDDISGGRVTVGIGAGSVGWDATMLGQDRLSLRQWADRFQEFVELTDQLLRGGRVNYSGRFFVADEARMYPGCVQRPRPPFAIAATGRRGLELTARFADIWVTTGDRQEDGELKADEGVEVIARQIARLEDACDRQGRDPKTIGRLVLTGVGLDPELNSARTFLRAIELYSSAGVSDFVVHWPRPTSPFAVDPTAFERAIDTAVSQFKAS